MVDGLYGVDSCCGYWLVGEGDCSCWAGGVVVDGEGGGDSEDSFRRVGGKAGEEVVGEGESCGEVGALSGDGVGEGERDAGGEGGGREIRNVRSEGVVNGEADLCCL